LVGVVVEDIKTLAASLSYVTFQHVSRICNSSAHTMARRAELSGSCLYLINKVLKFPKNSSQGRSSRLLLQIAESSTTTNYD
jgi:hypothetical protein